MNRSDKYNLITITGPTACGKTAFAVRLAKELDGEIISADSRQVYKGMDIGTGKDLDEYKCEDGTEIKHHLIDIVEAGEKYNLYEFQRDFKNAYNDITSRGKLPIMCGGTGLYIESIIKGYEMMEVPENKALRQELEGKSIEELTQILSTYKTLHNTTDVDSCKRAIRAIEIEEYQKTHNVSKTDAAAINSLTIGINIDREERREKITRRLKQRLDNGLIEEVEGLLNKGIAKEDLIYYGLEYKFVTLHVTGELTRSEMERQLEIAIHQFAKRQMTWFRGMEKRGCHIEWIESHLPVDEKIDIVRKLWQGE
ncbi:MAG: tRNA (adenosine(37)-N6)-dimethylallyltransferase MiaA [Paludibacteraceae bacterium]|nr:tRNA (adenosine(37)-N6)-dimethylallyltransferase MiaA [Paludibacteraceae bacterium]MBP5743020.1 tRNA (adenosine(37)-N6)-dimethylallyltransferase MiaA [Paludibacteraceae bacterium]